jgi:hypothetical protein
MHIQACPNLIIFSRLVLLPFFKVFLIKVACGAIVAQKEAVARVFTTF